MSERVTTLEEEIERRAKLDAATPRQAWWTGARDTIRMIMSLPEAERADWMRDSEVMLSKRLRDSGFGEG